MKWFAVELFFVVVMGLFCFAFWWGCPCSDVLLLDFRVVTLYCFMVFVWSIVVCLCRLWCYFGLLYFCLFCWLRIGCLLVLGFGCYMLDLMFVCGLAIVFLCVCERFFDFVWLFFLCWFGSGVVTLVFSLFLLLLICFAVVCLCFRCLF